MPDAIADGWLVAFIVAFFPIVYGIAKSVANRWKAPLMAAEAVNERLKEEAVERTNALTEAKIRIMFLEARLESCEGELENWRSGKWSPR